MNKHEKAASEAGAEIMSKLYDLTLEEGVAALTGALATFACLHSHRRHLDQATAQGLVLFVSGKANKVLPDVWLDTATIETPNRRN